MKSLKSFLKLLPKKKFQIILGLCIFHLANVCLGAFNFPYGNSWLGRTLAYYGYASGASMDFGFFAQESIDQIRVLTEIRNANKPPLIEEFKSSSFREAIIKEQNILQVIARRPRRINDEKSVQRRLTNLIARLVFNRHEEAQSLVIKVEKLIPVTMQEYREGKRSSWMEIASKEYTREN